MLSGQSSIRNKTLAPVFKRLGIIEQWGNGLKLIAEELKNYPEIGFEWKEPGVAFRVIFLKKNGAVNGLSPEVTEQSQENIQKTSVEKPIKASVKTSKKILALISENNFITIHEIAEKIGVTVRSVERNIQKLQIENKLVHIGPKKGGRWKILPTK